MYIYIIYIYIYIHIFIHTLWCVSVLIASFYSAQQITLLCAPGVKFKSETSPPKHTGALSKLNMIYKKENNLPLTPKASILIKLF